MHCAPRSRFPSLRNLHLSSIYRIFTSRLSYHMLLLRCIHSYSTVDLTAADTEVPKVLFCPPDIVKETAHNEIRVNWERPRFSDNSGNDPVVTGNRQSGDYFSSPGKNQIIYTATDQSGNEAHCSFTIQLSSESNTLRIGTYANLMSIYKKMSKQRNIIS